MRQTKASSAGIAYGLFLITLAACASKRPAPEAFQGPRPAPVYQKPIGPEMPTEALNPQLGHKEAPQRERRIHLVLGGAGVASFATIGILKRFHEEGFHIETIFSTGWPSLFALGYGYQRSIHDLEWFATMRLKEGDLKRLLVSDEEEIPELFTSTFIHTDIRESKVPLVLSSPTPNQPQGEVWDRGDWKNILRQSMLVPGMWKTEIHVVPGTFHPLEVVEALRRGGTTVVAVEMYDDYIEALKNTKPDNPNRKVRKALAKEIRSAVEGEIKQAPVSGRIVLGRPPENLSARRAAILAGYREGIRLAKLIRSIAPAP